MNSDPLIRCENIDKDYQLGQISVHALQDINLTIHSGEYVAILGVSGSGKSTLMSILGCLDKPTRGRYFFDNVDISQLDTGQLAIIRNQKIGFIFQSFHLMPYATALENVALPLMYRGIKLKERQASARLELERVGLADRMQHHPNELSGGQQQRVAIARALVTKPKLLLADEPTGNLDSASGKEIMKIFDDCLKAGATIAVVTHDNQLAKRMQKVIRLQDGRIVSDS
jgi:putative ABC transport system ATP-binding protein